MNWAKERDLLIAQTMTFVQSITGKKPEAETRTETRIEFAPVDQIEKVERPVEIVQVARPSTVPRSGMREEIQGRVAAFRAHQQLFDRERDAYFKSVLTRVRASTAIQPKPPGN
jgi:predicted CoA-binding protein